VTELAAAIKVATVSFFESLLALLLVAILFLQVSRRLAVPYPTMLAMAGVALALVPGAPRITLAPHTALPLFVAPALVDAAVDFPLRAVWRLWRPLVALAVWAVVLSAGAVAWLGVTLAGLPFYAAVALGAIVAPPAAAAATAVLSSVSMPRRTVAVLQGESLLNDASALLLFGAATSIPDHGRLDAELALRLALAAPGGVVAGILLAKGFRHVVPFVTGTLGGTLLEFVTSFVVWIVAERLGLSPVLCLVAFAMTIARPASLATRPRTRIHSFAVWETAVFSLNVLAFLLMGLQARTIVGAMPPGRLRTAVWFALAVIACLVVVRMAWVLLYNRLARRSRILRGDPKTATFRHGVLVGWSGMRGLVTLATAFALPAAFPQRDLVVFTAFAVVLATLIVQGLTLAPLVRLLKLDGDDDLRAELFQVRADLARVALATLDGRTSPAAAHWRYRFEQERSAFVAENTAPLQALRSLGLAALRRQREQLDVLRSEQRVGPDAFLLLQEELDFEEVTVSSEDERHIEES
jgi:CPA1 family monovalent cation:H+ antiporter